MRLGLRGKVLIIAAVVLVAVTAALVATSSRYFGDALARAQLSRAQSVAQGLAFQIERILALGLDARHLKGFEQQCVEAVDANEGLAFAMVVSPDGEVLFHSDAARMHKPLPAGPLREALGAGTGAVDDAAQGLHFALASAHDRSTEVRAVVVIASPRTAIDAARNAMLRTLVWVGAAVAVVGLLLMTGALSRFVIGPLDEVVAAIERLGPQGGTRALPLPTLASTELTILVQGFNGLLGRLAAHERELVAAKDAAEAANRAKTHFLAMMSHELRTPMNAALGMAELLATTPLNDRQRRYLESMKTGSASLLATLDDILNYTRLEMGDLMLRQAPFALPRLVERTVAQLRESARSKGVSLGASIEAGVPAFVLGDEGRIRRVLLSLVGNAIKFTERGGVQVRVASTGGDRIRIAVTDTGIGVDPGFRQQLFGAFTQQDTGYARRYGGSGLGLAIAKRLCEAMEGSIDMEPNSEDGSTFWFELPLPAVEGQFDGDGGDAAMKAPPAGAAGADTQGAAAEARKPPIKVLVVEDNPLNQELVLGYLEETDYEVTLAGNGRAGVDGFGRARFDAVLMDWQMPEMDGIEATRLIRAMEQAHGLRRTPIIGVTAHAMPGDRDTCIAAGMDDYLVKPYTQDALLEMLARWTART
jgi:signal transduction histidine kinase/ActR/RegA family two-component response regulator